MLRKKRRPPEKGTWIITYSDMITLLLCFFILMYSSSTIDSVRWQNLIRSLNPAAAETPSVDYDETGDVGQVDIEEEELSDDEEFDRLYREIRRHIEENDMTEDVQVFGGDGFAFIVFRNNILFEGDRYHLTASGREILDFLADGISVVSHLIREVRILGHTNQADPHRPNDVRGDRFLASNRATEVLVYLQEKDILEPRRLTSTGYGQFFPIAPFDSEEERHLNRRVEILITEAGTIEVSMEDIYEHVYGIRNN